MRDLLCRPGSLRARGCGSRSEDVSLIAPFVTLPFSSDEALTPPAKAAVLVEPPFASDGFYEMTPEWTSENDSSFGFIVNRPGTSLFLIAGDTEAGSAVVDAATRRRVAAGAGCGKVGTPGAQACYFLPKSADAARMSVSKWLRIPRASSQVVVTKDFLVRYSGIAAWLLTFVLWLAVPVAVEASRGVRGVIVHCVATRNLVDVVWLVTVRLAVACGCARVCVPGNDDKVCVAHCRDGGAE